MTSSLERKEFGGKLASENREVGKYGCSFQDTVFGRKIWANLSFRAQELGRGGKIILSKCLSERRGGTDMYHCQVT